MTPLPLSARKVVPGLMGWPSSVQPSAQMMGPMDTEIGVWALLINSANSLSASVLLSPSSPRSSACCRSSMASFSSSSSQRRLIPRQKYASALLGSSSRAVLHFSMAARSCFIPSVQSVCSTSNGLPRSRWASPSSTCSLAVGAGVATFSGVGVDVGVVVVVGVGVGVVVVVGVGVTTFSFSGVGVGVVVGVGVGGATTFTLCSRKTALILPLFMPFFSFSLASMILINSS